MKLLATMLSLALVIPAYAQDDPPGIPQDPPGVPQGKGGGDCPDCGAGAMGKMKHIQKMMTGAEEALLGASMGKAVVNEKEVLKHLDDLDSSDPVALQKQVMKLIDKLVKKSSDTQKDVVKHLKEMIEKAKQ